LWSPKVNDIEDEFEIDVEEEDYHSINRNQHSKGKWLSLWVTPMHKPDVRIAINCAEE
jgi:hypothetical protein